MRTFPLPAPSPTVLGCVAIALFSATAVGTRSASLGFGGLPAGCGRLLLGGMLATSMLAVVRPGWPTAAQWRVLLPVALGCGLGFPILLSLALDRCGAGHAAVVLGLIPLLTTLLSGERLSARMTAATVIGTLAVVGEAWLAGGGGWTPADALLGGAVVMAAVGYVAGARLARTMPGWQVICWGVAAPLPATVIGTAVIASCTADLGERIASAPASAWFGLLWIGLVSQVLGFLPWYAALARGGIASVGRLQLLQPGLSVLLAWILLGDAPRASAMLALGIVCAALVIGRRAIPLAAPTSERRPSQSPGTPRPLAIETVEGNLYSIAKVRQNRIVVQPPIVILNPEPDEIRTEPLCASIAASASP